MNKLSTLELSYLDVEFSFHTRGVTYSCFVQKGVSKFGTSSTPHLESSCAGFS
jgi:hypothetical protein